MLARCRDRGELSSEEIAEMRELGKRAVGLLEGIRDRWVRDDSHEISKQEITAAWVNLEELVEDHSLEAETGRSFEVLTVDEDTAVHNERKEDSESSEVEAGKQIKMVLDMIITVIGEVYGQRDLLEFRDIWDEAGQVD